MPRSLVALLLALPLGAALRLGEVPPGKVFLVILPHHDDHTWEYTFGGLIAKFVDAGYTGYYVRVTNDEKDGAHGWAENNIINHREALEAVRYLGMKDVISLNWRNDHSDSVPLDEMRAQLILLIRKYRPDAVMAYSPWGHYDRNPDHRKSARAVAEAVWAAGNPHFLPEHFRIGLAPYRVPYRYYAQRGDYGMGYRPNIAFELNASQMERKSKAYWMNRNIRLQPSIARSLRGELAREHLVVPELEGLDDIEATKKLQEWRMYWISELRGKENGVKYAEVFDFADEFDDVPGLLKPARSAARQPAPRQAGSVLVVTAHSEDYLAAAGGTLAGMIASGATVYVLRMTDDEKENEGLASEVEAESSRAARILGVKELIWLGYRSGELAAVSPTELRDRILFFIRDLRPRALFIPDPYAHHDDRLDHYYVGSAAEEARMAAALANFQPPFALAGLATYLVPELYYYALNPDAEWGAESSATFAPQPRIFDVSATVDRKRQALAALRGANRMLAADLRRRMARSGHKFSFADDGALELRVPDAGRESFLYAGAEYQVPAALR